MKSYIASTLFPIWFGALSFKVFAVGSLSGLSPLKPSWRTETPANRLIGWRSVEDSDDGYLQIVQDLFALITSLCEDAAEIAMDGQSYSEAATASRLAANLAEAGQRIVIVANGIRTLA